MAVTATPYGALITGIFGTTAARRIDWASDTVKCLLTTSSYTPDVDTHDFLNDITNEVANGSGYTTGGVSLANKTVTYVSASNKVVLDADDASWTLSGSKTARYGVVYKDTGVSSTSPLIGYVDFGADQTSSGTFKITWDATDGVMKLTIV